MIYFPILGELGIEGNCFVPAKGTHQLALMATNTVFILSFYDLFSNFGGIGNRGKLFRPCQGYSSVGFYGYQDSFYFIFL